MSLALLRMALNITRRDLTAMAGGFDLGKRHAQLPGTRPRRGSCLGARIFLASTLANDGRFLQVVLARGHGAHDGATVLTYRLRGASFALTGFRSRFRDR